MPQVDEVWSRALGALYGLAIGDALGMPTQSLSRAEIEARYGGLVTTFWPGPPDHPLAAGLPAGTVTDDTEQAVLLARLVIEGDGETDPGELAVRLLAWEESMRARGSHDLLGPSSRRALAALSAGAGVDEAGRYGVTNGAAMRVTPVGIATPACDLPLLVDRVVGASRLTHNTGIALAGAAAVAAAVSAGIDGSALPDAIALAVSAAAGAAGRGHRARPGSGQRYRVPAGWHQPGGPGIGPRRVRGGRRRPRRPLAGLPCRRIPRRRLRHDRRDDRSHLRCLSWGTGVPAGGSGHGGQRQRPGPRSAGRRSAHSAGRYG